MKKIAVLTGAGVSADSGIPTFRGADGLWEGHDVTQVASPEGWENNPELVLDFYNQRRKGIRKAKPNAAHYALAELEKSFHVDIITQNIDDLHERAGSKNVLHLHGEIMKARSSVHEELIYELENSDIFPGDLCEKGHQLRPYIVWFGEMVPMMLPAAEKVAEADVVLIIGTSMIVYPAASLVNYARQDAKIYYVDPEPADVSYISGIEVIAERAYSGVPQLVKELLKVENSR